MFLRYLLPLLALLSTAFFVFWPEKGESKPNKESRPLAVKTAQAAHYQPIERLNLVSKLQASQAINISSQVAGVISHIAVTPNEYVAQGQLLFGLDDAKAKAKLAEEKADLSDQRRLLNQYQALLKRQAVSATEFEGQQAKVAMAAARVELAQAELEDYQIFAPFAGHLGLFNLSVGELVSAGASLVSLDNLSQLYLDLAIPEHYLPQLQQDLAISGRSQAWGEQRFDGQLQYISPRIDPEALTLQVRVGFDNAQLQLKPGMLLNVELALSELSQVMVPVQAIEYLGTKRFVYVVDAEQKAQRREVVLGKRLDDHVVITRGLEQGEHIVVQGLVNIREGMQITEAGSQSKGNGAKTNGKGAA